MAKTYDLKRCLITVNGVPISGFQEGDAVSVEYNEDAWTLAVGADGEAMRQKTNNRSGKITFNLLYSSNANTVFQALATLDEVTNLGQAAIFITDLASGTKVIAPQAWVMKPPALTLGAEGGVREWVFETGDLILEHGGIPI